MRDTHHLTGLLVDDAPPAAPPAPGRGARQLLRRRPGLAAAHHARRGRARSTAAGAAPAGRVIRLAAVVPQFTWIEPAPGARCPTGATTDTPLGIGKLSIVDGLTATANTKLPPETLAWIARLNAGEPYDDPSDPVDPRGQARALRWTARPPTRTASSRRSPRAAAPARRAGARRAGLDRPDLPGRRGGLDVPAPARRPPRLPGQALPRRLRAPDRRGEGAGLRATSTASATACSTATCAAGGGEACASTSAARRTLCDDGRVRPGARRRARFGRARRPDRLTLELRRPARSSARRSPTRARRATDPVAVSMAQRARLRDHRPARRPPGVATYDVPLERAVHADRDAASAASLPRRRRPTCSSTAGSGTWRPTARRRS